MSTEPTFSSSMLADLEALARGEPLPGRDWSQRPWKIGEPCYTVLVGPGGDLHAYPCRVVTWNPEINVGTPEKPIPMMEAKYDSLNGWAMTLPQGTFKCLGLLPRTVDGEVW